MDRRCRESEGKAKIEGYMSVSDEEAHHRLTVGSNGYSYVRGWSWEACGRECEGEGGIGQCYLVSAIFFCCVSSLQSSTHQ